MTLKRKLALPAVRVSIVWHECGVEVPSDDCTLGSSSRYIERINARFASGGAHDMPRLAVPAGTHSCGIPCKPWTQPWGSKRRYFIEPRAASRMTLWVRPLGVLDAFNRGMSNRWLGGMQPLCHLRHAECEQPRILPGGGDRDPDTFQSGRFPRSYPLGLLDIRRRDRLAHVKCVGDVKTRRAWMYGRCLRDP